MFKCNGKTWNLAFVEPYNDNLTRSDGSRTVGVTDNNTKCIYINNRLEGAFLKKVIIHEVCHSAMFSYEIDMDIQQEEFLCDWVATYGEEVFDIVDGICKVIKKRAS